MQKYSKVRGAENGPLFCYRSVRPAPRTEFCALLRSSLKFAQLDSTAYKAHSFRIGASTEAHPQEHKGYDIWQRRYPIFEPLMYYAYHKG